MKTFKYNYCILTKDVIYLSEEKITCRPAFDTYLENVNIDIYDNFKDMIEQCKEL